MSFMEVDEEMSADEFLPDGAAPPAISKKPPPVKKVILSVRIDDVASAIGCDMENMDNNSVWKAVADYFHNEHHLTGHFWTHSWVDVICCKTDVERILQLLNDASGILQVVSCKKPYQSEKWGMKDLCTAIQAEAKAEKPYTRVYVINKESY
jgi:hypothetical protein